MAYEIPGASSISVPAHDDLSLKQFCFVTLNSDREAIAITADTQYPTGILQNNPGAGEIAEIMLFGVSKLLCHEGITCPALVGPAHDGSGITRTLVHAEELHYICGQVLETSTVADEIITIILRSPFAAQIEA